MGRNRRGGIEHFLERSTRIVRKTSGLVGALASLGSQIALASFLAGMYQPSVNELPKGCTPETFQVRGLSPYKAADEIFWKRHPELRRRPIRRGEGKYSDEWWSDLQKVSRCRE